MFRAEASPPPLGEVSWAAAPGPPSPEKPELPNPPAPATVVMMPAEFTLRTRLVPGSAMYRFPLVSAASPMCVAPVKTSPACVACPPSPMFAGAPPPANGLMIPVDAEIFRTLFVNLSATYTLPELSTATPTAVARAALVAGPPSPVETVLRVPVQATVVMIPWPLASPTASRDTTSGNAPGSGNVAIIIVEYKSGAQRCTPFCVFCVHDDASISERSQVQGQTNRRT